MNGVAALRRDVEALSAMVRDSAGAGERRSAAWLARRLREAGADEVRVDSYRGHGTYAYAQAAHVLAGLLLARLPGWVRVAAAGTLLWSFAEEVSGRRQLVRRLLPTSEGANVVGRVGGRGAAGRTFVLVAHHDAARTGWQWSPRLVEAGAGRRLRARRMQPLELPPAIGLLLAGLGARRSGRLLLALSAAALADTATSPTVPGASDNATGVAALIALAQRLCDDPLDAVDVLLVAPGSEESGMAGMRAFLREQRLDPATTFVLGLDTLGAGEPLVCAGEQALVPHAYRAEDLDVVDAGAAAAGEPAPQRWWLGGWTDPILARLAGLPAASLLSVGPKGHFRHYHRMSDVPAHVDWRSVERCAAIAEGTVRAWAAVRAATPDR